MTFEAESGRQLGSYLPGQERRFSQCRAALISVVILALLGSRLALPHFDHLPTFESTFKNERVQHHKQSFEGERLDWTAPARASQSIPRSEVSECFTPPTELTPQLRLRGPHYNRPPPFG